MTILGKGAHLRRGSLVMGAKDQVILMVKIMVLEVATTNCSNQILTGNYFLEKHFHSGANQEVFRVL